MSNQVKSGVSVILNLTSRIRIPKLTDYVDNLYLKFCNIRRGDKESLKDYTTRAITSKLTWNI